MVERLGALRRIRFGAADLMLKHNAINDPRKHNAALRLRSLIARAGVELGNAIAPAAHASNLPIKLSAYAPLVSPSPLRRPGGESPLLLATTPQPKPEKPASDKQALSGWAVQLGVFAREETAIAELASVALSDINGLQSAGRDVLETELSGQQAWRAQLTGLSARL